jgi:hypothetical protein
MELCTLVWIINRPTATTLAIQAVETATLEIDLLLSEVDAYRQAVAGLPRRFSLLHQAGKCTVEVPKIREGRPIWRN